MKLSCMPAPFAPGRFCLGKGFAEVLSCKGSSRLAPSSSPGSVRAKLQWPQRAGVGTCPEEGHPALGVPPPYQL